MAMNPTSSAITELQSILAADELDTGAASLYAVSMDNLRYSRMPSLRILPRDEESVARVLAVANRSGVAITVRGSGSATTGATTPLTGSWVMDLSHWNQIHIDPVAKMAFVQPGATIAAIDEAAAADGLSYPVDPGSQAYASIGGSIATNAGGMRAAKYGVTRDYVLSLEGFLPTGKFVRWGGNLRKFAAGFNLRDLWIGSEGCLGVITGAVLKLVARPAARGMAMFLFPDNEAALAAVQRLLRTRLTPSACEYLDQQTLGAAFSFWKRKDAALLQSLPAQLQQFSNAACPPAALLVEVDGAVDSIHPQLLAAAAALTPDSPLPGFHTAEAAMAALWKLRKACSQAMFELGPAKLNEDVVVPFDAQIDLIRAVQQVHLQTGLPTPTFGHVADGNFHVHIMYDPANSAQTERAAKAVHALMQAVVNLGGAISGEHGIGLAKSQFLPLQFGEAEIQAMRAVKTALDPNHILNPDKLFHPVNPAGFPRESVRLPWDH